jgi:cytochrome o ubiquinol oxidase subunit 1
MKQAGRATAHRPPDEPIHLPRSSSVGFAIAFFSSIGGFALVWHIWWLAIVCLIGVMVASLAHGWIVDRDQEIPADEVAAFERAHGGAS